MTDLKIDLNDMVRVKLTEEGIRRYTARARRLNKIYPAARCRPLLPTLDAEGYYRAQLWTIIQDYGDKIRLGNKLPIESEFIVESLNGR